MATREEKIKEIEELYAKAVTQEEYHQVWELTQDLEREERVEVEEELEKIERGEQKGFVVTLSYEDRARAVLPGYWARYYELRKFTRTEDEVDKLYGLVMKYKILLSREHPELAVNYLYLLSVIVGQLKEDLEETERINKEMQQLVKDTNNVVLALREINTRGLIAIQKKDWQEAVDIFTTAEQLFPEVGGIPKAQQHLGNTINNRGLSKLNLSDEKQAWSEKRNLISSAITDLMDAEDLYMKVTPSPLKHIDGLESRLIMAAIRLLLTETKEVAEIGQRIKAAFEAKNRDEAKQIISGLKEIKIGQGGKIEEGEIPGDTIAFVKSIQLGLQMADEFLEKNKEAQQ